MTANGKVVPAERAVLLSLGVPHDRYWSDRAVNRALTVLKREGFACGLTSDAAVLQAAEMIRSDE